MSIYTPNPKPIGAKLSKLSVSGCVATMKKQIKNRMEETKPKKQNGRNQTDEYHSSHNKKIVIGK